MPARAFLLCLVATVWPHATPLLAIETPATVIDHPTATAVIKLEFGLRATEPQRWSGQAQVEPGTVQAVWGWHFDRPDRTSGTSGWDLEARWYSPPNARYRQRSELPSGGKILPNGVYLSVEAQPGSTVSVNTNRGDFSFTLADLRQRRRIELLDGNVAASIAPAVRALTRGEASQHDYPAAAMTEAGLFVAWTTFHNEANTLYLAWKKQEAWRTFRVTPRWGDYFGTALASDAEGRIHVIWSEYADGRWRLVDRSFDPASERWGRETYVSPTGTRQYFPVAVTATDRSPWVAWQEFHGDQLDVMAARFGEDGWSAPIRVSESDANDWAPDLAAGPDGSVWVAWDGYERGSYDIFLRRLLPDSAEPVIEVPADRNRAIEPSVAVDGAHRVWVAWAESGPNWGKDWGVLGRPGTQLRASSQVRVARYANGTWTEPVQSLQEAVPAWMSDMHEYPELVMGQEGVPHLFFRKMILRLPVEEHELKVKFGDEERRMQPWYDTIRAMSSIRMATFDGAQWSPTTDLPLSSGGAYTQLAFAELDGSAAAVWTGDGRTYQNPHVHTSQLLYASLDLNTESAAEERMRPYRPDSQPFRDAAPTEAADLERVRSARWVDKGPLKLFRGDLHRHTDLSADSQWDGDILFQYRYALDAGALDFLAVTDHSGAERLHYYKYQWWKTRQIATMFNQPGRFATFFGYERTVTFPGGHRNIISTRRAAQPVLISDEEFTGNESWSERLYPALLKHGDIAIAHTTAGGGGTDWRDNDPRAEPVVEVFQALRGSYEEPNSPGKANTNQHPGFVWSAWKKGWRIGLLSNSDHESTHQSYACVWAAELTNTAILDAIKQRRSYAATDNIVLKFEAISNGAQKVKMGGEFAATAQPSLSFRAIATAPVDSLEIVRSGEVVYASKPGTSTVAVDFRDEEAPGEGWAHYHVRIVQQDGQIAWSSPIWVDF